MFTKLRPTLPLTSSALALLLLSACASSPPQQEETVVAATTTTTAEAAPVAAAPVVSTPAAPVALRADYPQSYTVVRGDTLWDISARFLKNPWMWPEIWHGNPEIENPHLIYPGDVLRLHFIDGRPVLRVDRSGMTGDYRSERWSPRVREQTLDSAITAIPIDVIRPFLTRPRVMSNEELQAAPYVMAHDDGRLISGAGYRVFARGLELDELVSDYVLVRRGQAYTDPVSGEHLGFEAVFLGEARLQRFGDPSILLVTNSTREILNGDRLLPKGGDDVYQHRYLPRAPSDAVQGQIISVFDGVAKIGQHRVVALNLGQRDGIEPGHVLAVNQRGATVRDAIAGEQVTLPDERAGTVMVFRSFERVSYALVMQVNKPLALHDVVLNP